ncbi:MAG: T9SS type A sorting domain-containing protein, partial [Bacteroidota bacterium]|nr:T9SS type A sorting domain-containing protein [Bacteroidota bacterium]
PIHFPQFNDTMGIISCIRLSDTVTTVVNYSLENNINEGAEYNFETYRRSQFTGPGGFVSSLNSQVKTYGAFSLAAYDPSGTDDKVEIPSDTVFNKEYYTKYASGAAAYYGHNNDSVTFTYLTTSTFTILTGSDNAIIKLRAYTRLDVQLVYYFCPYSVLATHLIGFTTLLKDNNVIVHWAVNDPRETDKYEIEMSTDGRKFRNLGQGTSTLSGNVGSYTFIYSHDKNFSGNLFFRIKQTDHENAVLYSEIRNSYIKNTNPGAVKNTYSLYPNPTISGINLQFVKSNGGNYEVELFNSIGQSNFRKKYSLTQSSNINIEWPQKPVPGIYFLKVRDLNNKTEQVEKLQIL